MSIAQFFFDNFNQFSQVPLEEWQRIEPLCTLKKLKKDELFIHAQEIPTSFAIIKKGIFRLYYPLPDGNELIKAFRTDNELLGAYAEMLQQIPSRIHVQALTDSEIYVINAGKFQEVTQGKLCWEVLQKKIAEWHFLKKDNREYEFLTLDAKQRYEAFKKEHPNIHNQIHGYHVASYIRVTPSSLSRLRKEIK